MLSGINHEGVLRWRSLLGGGKFLRYAPVVRSTVDPGRRPSMDWFFMAGVDPSPQVDHVVKRILRDGRKYYRRRSSLAGFRIELERTPGQSAVLLPIVLSMMGEDAKALAYIDQCLAGKKPQNRLRDEYQAYADAFAAACPLAIEGPPST